MDLNLFKIAINNIINNMPWLVETTGLRLSGEKTALTDEDSVNWRMYTPPVAPFTNMV